jgi:DNA-binding response OmpR family regulator
MKILIAEDERSLAISMQEVLEDENYEVDIFAHSDDVLEAMHDNSYDLILLDVKIHGINGFELLKTIRECGDQTPTIFVTSQTSIDDLTNGFESGCCDYIRKPFEMKELLLRVENVIKAKYQSSSKSNILLPLGYRYDASKYKLFKEDEEISLTKTEVKIIEILIKNRGSVIPIEKFSDEVWNHSVLEANVRVQINQLRKKTDKNLIKNIRGLGYTIDS